MLFPEDIKLGNNNEVIFPEQIIHPEPAVYFLRDIYQVFMDKPTEGLDKLIYSIYQGVHYNEHSQIFTTYNLRFDLTVINPTKVGSEFSKTNGHFHSTIPNSLESYPEFYDVLAGEALFILQKNNRSGEVEEILAIEAKTNDKVFIPPNYGHLIINPAEDALLLGSLREANFKYITEPFTVKKGAAYYYVETETGKGDFIKNQNYRNSVGLQIMAAPSIDLPIELLPDKNLYENFIEDPENFMLLK